MIGRNRPRFIVLTARSCQMVVICLGLLLATVTAYSWLDRYVAVVRTEILAAGVSGKVIVIDAGHDGRDPGASGAGLLERDITLDIALRLAELIRLAGGRAILTREDDSDLSLLNPGDATRKRREIDYRLKVIADSNPDVMISIHANAVRSSRWYGGQTFFAPDADPKARHLAQLIQEELCRHTTTNRKPGAINQYLLVNCHVPATTVEVGFLSNHREARLLGQDEYRQKLAWAIFSGLVRYFADWQIVFVVCRTGYRGTLDRKIFFAVQQEILALCNNA